MTACTRCDDVAAVRDIYRDTPTCSLPEWIFRPEGQYQFDLAIGILSERYEPTVRPVCSDGCLDSWTDPDRCRALVRRMTAPLWN